MAIDFSIGTDSHVSNIGNSSTFKYMHSPNDKIFTVAAWINPTFGLGVGTYSSICGTIDAFGVIGSFTGFQFIAEEVAGNIGRLRLLCMRGFIVLINSQSTNILKQGWQWVCATGDNTNVFFYLYNPTLNQFLSQTGSGTFAGGVAGNSNHELHISSAVTGQTFNGQIEDVRIHASQFDEQKLRNIAHSMGKDLIPPEQPVGASEGRWDLMGGAEGEETGKADIIDLGGRLHGKVAFDTDSPEWANAPLKKVG